MQKRRIFLYIQNGIYNTYAANIYVMISNTQDWDFHEFMKNATTGNRANVILCFQNISKYILFLFRPMEVFSGVSGWKKLEV